MEQENHQLVWPKAVNGCKHCGSEVKMSHEFTGVYRSCILWVIGMIFCNQAGDSILVNTFVIMFFTTISTYTFWKRTPVWRCTRCKVNLN